MTLGAHPIRMGIIGAGIMGERMLRAAQEHARGVVDVTAVWDAHGPALDRLDLGGLRAASAQAVIDAADCVYVATPPGTHLAYADQAIAAHRAVFLEKPLATDVAVGDRAFAARTGRARIAVNFPFASSLAVESLRGWLDEDAIGTPTGLAIHVAFKTWPRPWQQGAAAWLDAPAEGGFTREVVSHFLFLARRLAGPLLLHEARVEHGVGGTRAPGQRAAGGGRAAGDARGPGRRDRAG